MGAGGHDAVAPLFETGQNCRGLAGRGRNPAAACRLESFSSGLNRDRAPSRGLSVDSHIQPLGGSEVNLSIRLEMMNVLNGVKFVDPKGVTMPDNGASVARVEEVFQNTDRITGSLGENLQHAFFTFRGDEPLHVGLKPGFIVG